MWYPNVSAADTDSSSNSSGTSFNSSFESESSETSSDSSGITTDDNWSVNTTSSNISTSSSDEFSSEESSNSESSSSDLNTKKLSSTEPQKDSESNVSKSKNLKSSPEPSGQHDFLSPAKSSPSAGPANRSIHQTTSRSLDSSRHAEELLEVSKDQTEVQKATKNEEKTTAKASDIPSQTGMGENVNSLVKDVNLAAKEEEPEQSSLQVSNNEISSVIQDKKTRVKRKVSKEIRGLPPKKKKKSKKQKKNKLKNNPLIKSKRHQKMTESFSSSSESSSDQTVSESSSTSSNEEEEEYTPQHGRESDNDNDLCFPDTEPIKKAGSLKKQISSHQSVSDEDLQSQSSRKDSQGAVEIAKNSEKKAQKKWKKSGTIKASKAIGKRSRQKRKHDQDEEEEEDWGKG